MSAVEDYRVKNLFLISSDWWAWFSDAVDGQPSSANAPGALLANILSYFQWLGGTCENYMNFIRCGWNCSPALPQPRSIA